MQVNRPPNVYHAKGLWIWALSLVPACTIETPSATQGGDSTAGAESSEGEDPEAEDSAGEPDASGDSGTSGVGTSTSGSTSTTDGGNEVTTTAGTTSGEAPTEGIGEDTGEEPSVPPLGSGFYVMENLDRGLVAVPVDRGIYVGWRMLGLEYRSDASAVAYELYRDGTPIATVTDSTNYLDAQGNAQSSYSVRVVLEGTPGEVSDPVTPWIQDYLRVPLERPSSSHSAHDSSVGDVDGDGIYEIFLLWQPSNAQDNSRGGQTGEVFLDALRLDGTRLWRIGLGPNIRAGEHYTQYIVIDADGDGRAELGVKTAPGTRDGTGGFLGLGPAANDDDNADYRNGDGYVLEGPEYFTVFDGLTGAELATAEYHVPRGNVNAWGDDYGNRVDRFLATAAYVDDSGLPSFVMARGYYTRSTLGAWTWRDGQLDLQWVFDSDQTPADSMSRPFSGQGAHSVSVANVDDDPEQEIIYGAMTVDHDGRGMCSSGMNHGDSLHVSDFMPDRPGMEVFMPTETTERPHWTIRDGATCEILRQSDASGQDVGRAVAADVVASNPGAELWASSGVRLTSFDTGQEVGGDQPNSINFLIWWDADELRELEDGTSVTKVGGGTLVSCGSCSSNNGTKSVPNLVADIVGDWREEVIWRESDSSALRIYTTTDITQRRLYTLMHDPQYRVAISWQNVGYNQPPHPGFYLGADMPEPPIPDIRLPPRAAP